MRQKASLFVRLGRRRKARFWPAGLHESNPLTKKGDSFQDKSPISEKNLFLKKKQYLLSELERKLQREQERDVEHLLLTLDEEDRIEDERLRQDHRVESRLLTRDIFRHYDFMYRENMLDCGFNKDVVLMFSLKYMDAEKAIRLREDFNSERKVKMHHAHVYLETQQKTEMSLLEQSCRKKKRLALEDKLKLWDLKKKAAKLNLTSKLNDEQKTIDSEKARQKPPEINSQGMVTRLAGPVQTIWQQKGPTSPNAVQLLSKTGEGQKILSRLPAHAQLSKVSFVREEAAIREFEEKICRLVESTRKKIKEKFEESNDRSLRFCQAAWQKLVERRKHYRRFRDLSRKAIEKAMMTTMYGDATKERLTQLVAVLPAPTTKARPGHVAQSIPHQTMQEAYGRQGGSIHHSCIATHAWTRSSTSWLRADARKEPAGCVGVRAGDVVRAHRRVRGKKSSKTDRALVLEGGGREGLVSLHFDGDVVQRVPTGWVVLVVSESAGNLGRVGRKRVSLGYVAVLEEELSVVEGDLVVVLSDEDAPPGWLLVEKEGETSERQRGLVPEGCLDRTFLPLENPTYKLRKDDEESEGSKKRSMGGGSAVELLEGGRNLKPEGSSQFVWSNIHFSRPIHLLSPL
eukprot:136857-Hanusia_phi.AAC.1